jgi:hypothetical protein
MTRERQTNSTHQLSDNQGKKHQGEPKSPRPKRGRPKGSTKMKPTEETLKQLRSLGEIQCTYEEAAAVFNVHVDTFSDFLRAHENCFDAFHNGRQEGCISLRRHQLKMAESNATMAIWCGKQYLKQSDKIESKQDIDAKVKVDEPQLETFLSRIAGLRERLGTDEAA